MSKTASTTAMTAAAGATALAAMGLLAAPAQAAPITLTPGTAITPQNGGGCNVAWGDNERNIFYTAGHCGKLNQTFTINGRVIGKVTQTTLYDGQTVDPNGRDYAVVTMAHGTSFSPGGIKGIGSPQVGDQVFKIGHGITTVLTNQPVAHGEVRGVTPNGVVTTIPNSPYDSGSPIIRKNADGSYEVVAIIAGTTTPLEALQSIGASLGGSWEGITYGTKAAVLP